MNKPVLNIIGGGITGLVAGYIAAKNGKHVRIFETKENFGGLLSSFKIGEEPIEKFYHHFFIHDKELLWLLSELNLEKNIFFKNTTMGVYRTGKIFEFNTLKDLLFFKPFGIFDKIRFVITSLYLGNFADWIKFENISAMKWLQKYAGENVTGALWGPLLKVKFGSLADNVPLSWMIGRIQQRMKSRRKGDERLGYIHGSFSVIVERLIERLKSYDIELISNAQLTKIKLNENQKVIKEIYVGDYLIKEEPTLITISSQILADKFPSTSPLRDRLYKLKYFGACCVLFELKEKLSNIYWLNITDDDLPFGGIIEHTNFVDPKSYKNTHIAYFSRYFTLDEKFADYSDNEIKTIAMQTFKNIYPDYPFNNIIKLHIFRSKSAAPVCDLNYTEKVVRFNPGIHNLYIANMTHLYPEERSVNNSIRLAAEVCNEMGMDVSFIPKGYSIAGKIGRE